MKYVIFSIDNFNNLHTTAKFYRYVDTKRAMGDMIGPVVSCVGCYKGDMELGFIVTAMDFDDHIKNSGYVDGQESFLEVSSDPRQPTVIQYSDGHRESVGKLVSTTIMPEKDSWIYRPDLGIYWSVQN